MMKYVRAMIHSAQQHAMDLGLPPHTYTVCACEAREKRTETPNFLGSD